MIDAQAYPNLIAATRMVGNVVAAFVLLGVGITVLHLLHRNSTSKSSRRARWAPVIAFMLGPLFATLYFVADVVWFEHGSYTIRSDYYDTYWRVLAIGFVAGALGAFAIWLESKFRRHESSNRYTDT